MWIIAVYLREELELQIRWCFKLFAGNWNLSNKHHLCEVQHQSSCCRNPFTWKPVFFLKRAEGMLFNECVNLRDCFLQLQPWNINSSEKSTVSVVHLYPVLYVCMYRVFAPFFPFLFWKHTDLWIALDFAGHRPSQIGAVIQEMHILVSQTTFI